MYRILMIETGEYLYRDTHGNLTLINEIPKYSIKSTYKIAEYKTRDRANMVFARKNERDMLDNRKYTNTGRKIILDFHIVYNNEYITLNKQSRCLFDIVEV